MVLEVIVTDSRAAVSSERVSMTAALCTTCRAVVQVPEDIKIQTMLSEAIKRIIKHHHKSLKECVSRAQLMCGDLSLVHSLIQVFSYGFKSARLFGCNLYVFKKYSYADRTPWLVFCPSTNETKSKLFLEQELSDLLLLHIYILQSGRCSRMARSMLTLARSGQSGALHNMT